MENKNLKNEHIEEVAAYLAQFTKFSNDEIARVLYKYEKDIEDIDIDALKNGIIKIYGDVIIFKTHVGEYEGINVRTRQYLNDYECYNLINPDFLLI